MLRLALLFIHSAFASSFYEQPFPETVRNAPTIVRGKIGKSETQWTALQDGSKHLFTYYDVDVSEGFKGGTRTGTPIRIRELGGTKDGVSMNVSGTAGFDKGEDVVVMLGEANSQIDGAYPVMGMMMGKFNLEKGADGKEYLRGPGIGSATHPGLRNEHSEEKTAHVSLDSLRDIIKTQASEAKAAPSPTTKPSGSEPTLLSAKAGSSPGVKTEIHDENIGAPAEKPISPTRPYLFGIGAAIGVIWFLKSRRKRR